MSRCRGEFLALIALCFVSLASFAQEPQPLSDAGVPARSNHVVVVMEENRSINYALEYMPYLGSLATEYSQGMQAYSDSHGSWLAYGELTSGMAPFGGSGDHGICNGDGCSQPINIPNLVNQLGAQGKTWKGYFQSMPYVGFMGYQSGLYVRRHNPFAFYYSLWFQPMQQRNMVPLDGYLLQDIENNRLPNFAWISPDLDHDAHNGLDDQHSLAAADAYLQTFVPQLLASPPFQPSGNGVLVVTFDEGEIRGDHECGGSPDPDNCGGHTWYVVIGPKVKRGYQSTTHYMQGSQLRMFCDLLGLTSCPGDGATSPSMSEFFASGTGTN
jgi:phosphatidylinositol-3-phosphatase